MNEKGFGLSGVLMFSLLVVIAIFMFYTFMSNVIGSLFTGETLTGNYLNEYSVYTTSSNVLVNSKYASYTKLENQMEQAALSYVDFNGVSESTTCTSLSTLKKQGYSLNSTSDSCSGYVLTANHNGIITSDAYIKCGDSYMTSGYEENLDK